jgi:hypothetical protein
MKVAIVHPDLGIGGAERLIVDAAVALKERGHEIFIYTSHHDPNHCFPETKSNQIDCFQCHSQSLRIKCSRSGRLDTQKLPRLI